MRKIVTGAAAGAAAGISAAVGLVAWKDRHNTDVPVRAKFPVAYWGRRIATELGPLLRQYWFSQDEDERPYNRVTRDWIYATARGTTNNVGFGSTYPIDDVGAMVFTPRTFTNKAATLEEAVGRGYRRVIGGRGTPPVVMEHWAFVSGMSYGALSERAIRALDRGARDAGCWHNTGEGGLSPAHLEGAGLIFQIGTAKFGIRNRDGSLNDDLLAEVAAQDNVRMFEVKLAQGAKPGKGGMLLKEKITPEIAEIRKIPLGEDCYSPPRHDEFDDVDGLFDFLDHVRGVTNKPVGIKLVIGHYDEIESIANTMSRELGRGPDFITVDGGEGGTGAAPLVLADAGVRDDVTLFASGRIATPADAAAALALGADGVGIARGNMLALGCIQSLRCHTNTCPTGITTQDPKRMRVLDVDAAAQRVTNYLTTLMAETDLLARSCGYTSPEHLQPGDVLMHVEPGRWAPLADVVTSD